MEPTTARLEQLGYVKGVVVRQIIRCYRHLHIVAQSRTVCDPQLVDFGLNSAAQLLSNDHLPCAPLDIDLGLRKESWPSTDLLHGSSVSVADELMKER